MANIRQTRRKLLWIAGFLLLVDVAALAVIISPLVGSGSARLQEFEDIRRQVQTRLKMVVPPDQVQQRVDEARKQIDGFYTDRLPTTMSAVSMRLGEVASQTGVRLLSAKYETTDADLPALQRVRISAKLSGDYLQEVKFINTLERGKLFFIVDGVTLGESQGGSVQLAVNLETYLRSGEPPKSAPAADQATPAEKQ